MRTTRIEDIAEFVLDGTHGSPVRTESGIPVLSAQNVRDGVLNFETDRYTSVAEHEVFAKHLPLQTGDLLLTIVGTIGRAAVLTEVRPLVFQRSVAVIRSKPDAVVPRFFYYASQTREFQTQLLRSSNQSSQAGIYLGKLKEVSFPLPSLPEQRRIAEVLGRAEALRAKRRAALAQLDTLTQSIFLDLFGDPATNPKGWPRHTLGEVTQKITDGEHLNPAFSDAGMLIVMAGNVLEDKIDLSSCKIVESSLGERFRRKCDPEVGDLLIVSRGATIGRLCAVETSVHFCMMGSVILAKPQKDTIDTRFLTAFLKHPVARSALYKTSGSSAQQAIYLKDVKNLVCIVPPISLQREFALQIAAVDKLKSAHRASLAKLDALFASLQHRAFRGEL